MLNLIGKQALKLIVVEEQRPAIKAKWCEEQQADAERFFDMVDNLVECAQVANASPLAYAQMQQAKADFVSDVLNCWAKYRLVEEPTKS